MKFIDLTGSRFGMLVALHRGENHPRPSRPDGAGRPTWVCACDCGELKTVMAENLRSGNTQSCGCVHGEHHGQCRTTEYNIWCNMWARCTNPKDQSYHNYGGRGIKVSEAWSVFSRFYQDMGSRPSTTYTLERCNNEKGYSASNCIWATQKVQGNNRRGNHVIKAFGRKQTLQQWSEEVGLQHTTILWRLKFGWRPERALSAPVWGGR